MNPQPAEELEVNESSPRPESPYDPRNLNLYKLLELIHQTRERVSEEFRRHLPRD